MYSFNFPSMLSSVTSRLLSDKDAVRSNVLLLLQSERNTLFGDPYFGTQLKRLLFEQSSNIVADIVIDELYTSLVEFIPQIRISRNDITVTSNGTDIFATVRYVYVMDNTVDLYTINLTDTDNVD